MKVGIDLSSTNTGLVILSDDNELIWHGNFQLWDNNRFVIASKVSEMIDYIKLKNPFNVHVMIGIELADFKNANITNRFHFLTGIIISELKHRNFISAICDQDNKLIMQLVKLFNSNEWQQHLGLKPHMERQFRKDTARQFVKSNCVDYENTWTEDECDAYCIAYFLPQLRDRTQMHQEVKANKVKAKKSKLAEKNEQIRKLKKSAKLSEIIAKYDKCIASGKKLTKSQINAQERAIKELKELKNE